MNQHLTKIDSRISLLAACAMGTAGVKIFSVLPLLLGTIADHLQLDGAQTGLVASYYYIAYLMVTLSSVFWVRRISWRILTPLGFGLLVVGLLVSAFFNDTYIGVVGGIMLSGLGAGIIFPLSVTLVSDMSDKDRRFAIKLVPEQLIPAGLMFLLPALVIKDFGLSGMLLALAAVIFALAFFSAGTPSQGRDHVIAQDGAQHSRSLVFFGLAALVIFFSGFAGLWAFMERLAHDSLDPVLVGKLLGLGLVSSAIGPLSVAVVGDRWGRTLPIMLGVILSVISICFLIGSVTAFKFGLMMAIFPGAYYFAIAYIFGIISDADISGRYASLIASALALGAGVGPAVFGLILDSHGNNGGYLFAGLTIAVGGIIFIWIERRLEQAHLCSFEEGEQQPQTEF